MTMQRMKRGELSRVAPSKAPHTDVYQPAPRAAAQVAPKGNGSNEVEALQGQLTALRAENKELKLLADAPAPEVDVAQIEELKQTATDAMARAEAAEAKVAALEAREAPGSEELDKAKEDTAAALAMAEAAEAKVAALEAREPPAQVGTVKVTTVDQVRSKGNTMRVDCVVEPTEGPLAPNVALYLTLEEGAKLQLEETEDAEESTDNE